MQVGVGGPEAARGGDRSAANAGRRLVLFRGESVAGFYLLREQERPAYRKGHREAPGGRIARRTGVPGNERGKQGATIIAEPQRGGDRFPPFDRVWTGPLQRK